MLADPDSGGVIIVTLALGFVLGAAVEGVDGVIGSEGGGRREDANLGVAEFVRLELAVLQADQKRVDSLDTVIHFQKIFGEETADCGEVTFCHGGPEMRLEVDDLDRGRGWVRDLRRGRCGECQEKEEGTHKTMVASDPSSAGMELLVGC